MTKTKVLFTPSREKANPLQGYNLTRDFVRGIIT